MIANRTVPFGPARLARRLTSVSDGGVSRLVQSSTRNASGVRLSSSDVVIREPAFGSGAAISLSTPNERSSNQSLRREWSHDVCDRSRPTFAVLIQRSEEHTSELQSRGLISYAVF